MTVRTIDMCACAALVLAGIAACNASVSTIAVTPSTLQATGWTIASQQSVLARPDGAIPTSGAAYGFETGYGNVPAGKGSFRMRVGYADSDPLPKVYLGSNCLSGIRLDRITKLSLFICPRENDYRSGQPATVELAVDSGNGKLRLLTFYPWSFSPSGLFGKLKWREVDLLGDGGAWEITNCVVQNARGNWRWLISRYSGARIMTPRSEDWPAGTLSGTGLCIKIGSGKATDATLESMGRNWWQESCGCGANVDKLTIGYIGADGNEVVMVFDFEPDIQD